MNLTLSPLRRDRTDIDYATFVQLLMLADLPTEDLMEAGRFFAVEDERGLVGYGGLEGSGPDQLIRSIAVAPGLRHRGFGHALTKQFVRQAKADGAERLWLLTTSAQAFFADLGWAVVDQEEAPEVVRGSRLFCEFCPPSAVLMLRRLA